ncbi:MAG: PEP-CTERM sorting domain-containing protein [Planctomycetota bacterium]
MKLQVATATASVLAVASWVSPVSASVILPGDAADSDINVNNVVVASGLNRAWNIAGTRSTDAAGLRNVLFVFDVSTLPTGGSLESISFNATYRETWNNAALPDGFAVDAYFVGFSSTAALDNDAPAEMVHVAADTGPGIKIADDLLVKGSTPANNTLIDEMGLGNDAFLSAMQGRATDGTENFAVFRINPDVALPPGAPGFRGFAFYQANEPAEANRPFLEYTEGVVIPEPGSLSLMSLGLLVIAKRRRR